MHFTKKKNQDEEPINFYEELFAKKSLEEHINIDNVEKENIEPQKKETIESIQNQKAQLENSKENMNNTYIKSLTSLPIVQTIKEKSRKIKLKYLVTGLLVGLIVNISTSHYNDMNLQHTSQKFATGLMYNLSETNDLEQIAKNIYLGMKENGWEPKVKVSNSNIFVFELEKGGEFTITKSDDVGGTNFHIEVNNFSNIMIKALMIQLEPNKFGGTANFITNKKYDAAKDKISFDIEKNIVPNLNMIGRLPTIEAPLNLPSLTPLSKNELTLPQPIISVPISPELEGSLNKIK